MIYTIYSSDNFFRILVYLKGGRSSNEGNVIAFNPRTGVTGGVCGDIWNYAGLSFVRIFSFAYVKLTHKPFYIMHRSIKHQLVLIFFTILYYCSIYI